jgi:hypothetical protein
MAQVIRLIANSMINFEWEWIPDRLEFHCSHLL